MYVDFFSLRDNGLWLGLTVFSARASLCLLLIVNTAKANDAIIPPSVNSDGNDVNSVMSFNPKFLMSTGEGAIDVSSFSLGNPVLPGDYRLDVYLNNNFVGVETVSVKKINSVNITCLTPGLLDRLSMDVDAFPVAVKAELKQQTPCLDEAMLPGVKTRIDYSVFRMDVSAPQVLLQSYPRGYVKPASWDSGVTAGLLSYDTSFYRSTTNGRTYSNEYAGIKGGFNIGEWMFRHTGAFTSNDHAGSTYQSTRNYVERDITSWQSRLTLGDANTSGDIFDTFAFRGVQLATSDQMWPDSMRGYAPVVRGIASTNARVSIRQNDVLLLERSVPPGEFLIDDLFPTGYGGDLDVTITEADGRLHTFKVPYSSIAQLLRPGQGRYRFMVGQIRQNGLVDEPKVVQTTYQYGLTNGFTPYAGFLGTEHYSSYLLGGAFDTPFGAVAIDATHSNFAVGAEALNGMSYRLTYSTLIEPTASSITVAAYRFSSENYLDLQNALSLQDFLKNEGIASGLNDLRSARSRLSITANQPLGEGMGQLFVSGYAQNYWGGNQGDKEFQIGYNNSFGWVNYSLLASRRESIFGRADNQFLVSMSVPIGSASGAPRLFSSVSKDNQGFTKQAMLSDSTGEYDQASYSVSTTIDGRNKNSTNLSGQYRFPYASIQGSYSKGEDYSSASAGISGSLVAHSGGVTASSYVSDTLAVVSAPGAGGARLMSYSDIALDSNGFAVVPYLSPYRLNEVSLDPENIPNDIELQMTSQKVAPRAGAVVALTYATVPGFPVLVKLKSGLGHLPPFGATVLGSEGQHLGSVTQGGQIYARVNGSNEHLEIVWGKDNAQHCGFDVALPENAPGVQTQASFYRLEATCL
ncbi:MAG: fimbrial biogenesis outer membrane usher protein [Pseudomonas sp.]|nr:fimbrial biogenesis outer membrane usher protein [Pseudomonas sp.]